VGRLGAGCIPGVGSPGVFGERVFKIEHPVQVSAAPAGCVKEAPERVGCSSHELRVPQAACAAQA
jgi:hypothetical protein